MQTIWIRISEWIIVTLTFGWLVADFGWKPVITFVIAVFAVIATEFVHYKPRQQSDYNNTTPPVREADRNLFADFLDLLPSDGAIYFIDQHNMAGWSFELCYIEPIDRFLHEWNNAEHEFIDVDLQFAKDELMAACRAWSRTIATETFRMPGGRQSVPPEWEVEQPERFDRVVTELHNQAQKIVDQHKRLVRIGRRRLLT